MEDEETESEPEDEELDEEEILTDSNHSDPDADRI